MNKGFSLIELMLVCAIVLIACAISIPTFFNKAVYDLDNELSKLEVIFTYLQQRACAAHQTQAIVIDVKNNVITWRRNGSRTPSQNSGPKMTSDEQNSTKEASYTLAPTLQFGFLPNSYGPPIKPTNPITQAVTFTKDGSPCFAKSSQGYAELLAKKQKHLIEFFSNGKISSGSIYLIDKKQQIMGALTIGVSQVSYIRRYAYQSGQWIDRH